MARFEEHDTISLTRLCAAWLQKHVESPLPFMTQMRVSLALFCKRDALEHTPIIVAPCQFL